MFVLMPNSDFLPTKHTKNTKAHFTFVSFRVFRGQLLFWFGSRLRSLVFQAKSRKKAAPLLL